MKKGAAWDKRDSVGQEATEKSTRIETNLREMGTADVVCTEEKKRKRRRNRNGSPGRSFQMKEARELPSSEMTSLDEMSWRDIRAR